MQEPAKGAAHGRVCLGIEPQLHSDGKRALDGLVMWAAAPCLPLCNCHWFRCRRSLFQHHTAPHCLMLADTGLLVPENALAIDALSI